MKSKLVIRTRKGERFIQTIDCPKTAMERVRCSLNRLFTSLGLDLEASIEVVEQ